MARFTLIQTVLAMEETGLVPLFYHSDPEKCREVISACYAGVTCVGMGSELITDSHVKAAAWHEITAKVRETLELIGNLRS